MKLVQAVGRVDGGNGIFLLKIKTDFTLTNRSSSHFCLPLVKMSVAKFIQDLGLAGGDPELISNAYEAFRERDTANRNEEYAAAVSKGLPAGRDGEQCLETTHVIVVIHLMERKYLLGRRFKRQVLEMEKIMGFVHGQRLRRMSSRRG
jgi:hypothetical protein